MTLAAWAIGSPSMSCKFCGTFYALDPRCGTVEIEMCELCYERALAQPEKKQMNEELLAELDALRKLIERLAIEVDRLGNLSSRPFHVTAEISMPPLRLRDDDDDEKGD